MRAVVVYESMFGNTHQVAQAISDGMAKIMEVTVVSASRASADILAGVDVIVAGGPTHVHSMSLKRTRAQAEKMAADSDGALNLDGDAAGLGIREWLTSLQPTSSMAAAFDTRTNIPRVFSGAASNQIDRALRRSGLRVVAPPMSFLVDSASHLEPAELERARAWGRTIARDAMSMDGAHPAGSRP